MDSLLKASAAAFAEIAGDIPCCRHRITICPLEINDSKCCPVMAVLFLLGTKVLCSTPSALFHAEPAFTEEQKNIEIE